MSAISDVSIPTALLPSITVAVRTLVPPEIHLEAVAGSIVVTAPSGKDIISVGDSLSDTAGESALRETIEGLLESVLSQLQQILTIEYRRPWPPVPGSSLSTFAPPFVEVNGGMLILGYATREQRIATASVSDPDWRLTGQETYLSGVTLVRRQWKESRPGWDHDHCEFCFAKFGDERLENVLREGWATPDEHRWICDTCFSDFKDQFKWHIERV
jgi:hypothetical protein